MKLSYFGYSVKALGNNPVNYLFDLRPFIRAFTNLDNAAFKNEFSYQDEKVFLLPNIGNLYLFLITRHNDIIKKIRSTDLSVSEIDDMLNADESLGFASYVYVGQGYIGFASTMMAPKSKAFVYFLNHMLHLLGIHNYQIDLTALMQQATRADALQMQFIGRSVIQVNRENSLYEDIRELLGGTHEDFSNVGSFELTFKPTCRQNIKPAVSRAINTLEDDGLERMLIKAKEHLSDELTDLYLAGKGQISDSIARGNGLAPIGHQIEDKIQANELLAEKVREHEDNEAFQKVEPEVFVALHDAAAWAARLAAL